MAKEIVQEVLWAISAENSFNSIIEYLSVTWTEKEVAKFVQRTFEMIELLKQHPEMCRPSAKRKNVRIGILNKRTQLIYLYSPRKKRIEILLFWDPRQDPAKLKY